MPLSEMETERRHRLRIILFPGFALACCVVSMFLFDESLSRAMRTLPPFVVDWFKTITVAGLGKWYIWSFGLAALGVYSAGRLSPDPVRAANFKRLAGALLFVCLAVLLSGLVTDIIKILIGRGRPVLLDRIGFYGFAPLNRHSEYQSFPSGHATTGAALAAALSFLMPRLPVMAPAVLFAVVIAASRVVVNAHYLGDVIGGVVVGVATVWLMRSYCLRRGWVFPRSP
ncbi:MAG: phosphatase PAP2 family protein [Rhodospirillaceae bacterium]